MTIRWYEAPESRAAQYQFGDGSRRYVHNLLGTSNDFEVRSYALTQLPLIDNDGYVLTSLDTEPVTTGSAADDFSWKVLTTYSHPDSEESKDGGGEGVGQNSLGYMDWTLRIGSEQGRIDNAIHQQEFPGGFKDDDCTLRRAIEAVDGGEVRGVDIHVPSLELIIWRIWPRTMWKGSTGITNGKTLAAMVGMTNKAAWWGFEQGELLYVGTELEDIGTKLVKATYHFPVSANRRNIDMGQMGDGFAVNIPLKRGHEYLWTYSRRTKRRRKDAAIDEVVTVPWRAYVAQVYEEADYSKFGLGSVAP